MAHTLHLRATHTLTPGPQPQGHAFKARRPLRAATAARGSVRPGEGCAEGRRVPLGGWQRPRGGGGRGAGGGQAGRRRTGTQEPVRWGPGAGRGVALQPAGCRHPGRNVQQAGRRLVQGANGPGYHTLRTTHPPTLTLQNTHTPKHSLSEPTHPMDHSPSPPLTHPPCPKCKRLWLPPPFHPLTLRCHATRLPTTHSSTLPPYLS